MPRTTPATQDFVAIKDIRGNVVLLKNGQMCSVLLVSSINFALKSLDEQKAILHSFQAFLNTLDFSLQIYVQSRQLNIEPYLATLSSLEGSQDNDLMRIQLKEYMEFIRTFTTEVTVMTKSFFVVVPYTPAPINFSKSISALFKPGQKSTPEELMFDEHKIQLEQRVAIVEQGLSRLGVRSIPLGAEDLVELYYHIYNPTDPTGSAPVVNS